MSGGPGPTQWLGRRCRRCWRYARFKPFKEGGRTAQVLCLAAERIEGATGGQRDGDGQREVPSQWLGRRCRRCWRYARFKPFSEGGRTAQVLCLAAERSEGATGGQRGGGGRAEPGLPAGPLIAPLWRRPPRRNAKGGAADVSGSLGTLSVRPHPEARPRARPPRGRGCRRGGACCRAAPQAPRVARRGQGGVPGGEVGRQWDWREKGGG